MTNTNFGPTPNTQSYSPIPAADQPYGYGPPAPYYAPVPVPAQDPGRTLGVVGLILSIVASAVGLVVSIVAHTKSKRAGFRNTAVTNAKGWHRKVLYTYTARNQGARG